MKTPNLIITMTSLPNPEIARSIAKRCIETRLAACVQIMPQIESIYFWDNQIRTDSETLI
jgi:periplasmic divalent cation tolerance protein